MKFEMLDEIMTQISKGHYPLEPIVPVAEPFINAAGSIFNLCWVPFASASLITSVAGSVRSNHYHETDFHFIYVIDGLMHYYWRNANSLAAPERRRCPPGTLLFTRPLVEHATFFPVATNILTLNRRARDHQSHESDLTRVRPLVTNEVCTAVSSGIKCCLPYQNDDARDWRNPIHPGDHESIEGATFSF